MDLSAFIPLPKEILKEGFTLPLNVHVHLPNNKSIVHYRKVGDVITRQDVEFFNKVNPLHLLLPKSELPKLYEIGSKAITADLKAGNVSSPALKATAASVLSTVSSDSNLAESIQGISTLVQDLISQFKKTPSVTAYDEALKRAASHSHDPLTAHHQQVSSISVLMAITAGDFSMDDLSDLAAAGLIHDLGLKEITNSLADSHIKGMKKLVNQEKLVYMRHLDLSLERIKKEKLGITPGIQRIVELHHENWDGTGFKGQMGTKIYRPARLIRIADDLVSLIQDPTQSLSYQEALLKLRHEKGAYDPVILDTLMATVKG